MIIKKSISCFLAISVFVLGSLNLSAGESSQDDLPKTDDSSFMTWDNWPDNTVPIRATAIFSTLAGLFYIVATPECRRNPDSISSGGYSAGIVSIVSAVGAAISGAIWMGNSHGSYMEARGNEIVSAGHPTEIQVAYYPSDKGDENTRYNWCYRNNNDESDGSYLLRTKEPINSATIDSGGSYAIYVAARPEADVDFNACRDPDASILVDLSEVKRSPGDSDSLKIFPKGPMIDLSCQVSNAPENLDDPKASAYKVLACEVQGQPVQDNAKIRSTEWFLNNNAVLVNQTEFRKPYQGPSVDELKILMTDSAGNKNETVLDLFISDSEVEL